MTLSQVIDDEVDSLVDWNGGSTTSTIESILRTTTVHDHFEDFDFHPGWTTLVSCAGFMLLLLLYLILERMTGSYCPREEMTTEKGKLTKQVLMVQSAHYSKRDSAGGRPKTSIITQPIHFTETV
ncbi:unnamed protein product [Clavelina lepadiformis]|uniref:Uncharacterized protein n=1 Tax=Clavelina lepadiformis TaxID=159417 RepID=A0ABP0GEC4_CLALP